LLGRKSVSVSRPSDELEQQARRHEVADVRAARVHRGPEAARLAEAFDARAITFGRDIFVAAGEARTVDGRDLIAHEMAHVSQHITGAVQAAYGAPAVMRSELTYIEQETDPEKTAGWFKQLDAALAGIEQELASAKGESTQELARAAAKLTELRRTGKVVFWYTSGKKSYASYEPLAKEIRLHINSGGNMFNPENLVHEAVHAVLAVEYPQIARRYGLARKEGREPGSQLLKYKAWTEYWAWRRQWEFYNLRQTPENKLDAHKKALEEPEVIEAIARVGSETRQRPFDPTKWKPEG
jgi:hypothetical protein